MRHIYIVADRMLSETIPTPLPVFTEALQYHLEKSNFKGYKNINYTAVSFIIHSIEDEFWENNKDTPIILKMGRKGGIFRGDLPRQSGHFYQKKKEHAPPAKKPFPYKNEMKILGLEFPFDQEDLKKAFKQLALKTHPDQGGDATEFIKVNSAYETLMNIFIKRAEKRANEDNAA